MLTLSNFIFASTYSDGNSDKNISVKKVEKLNNSENSNSFFTTIPGKYYDSFPQPDGTTEVVCLGEEGTCIRTITLNPGKFKNNRIEVFLNGEEESSFTADATFESADGHYIFHNVKY